MEKSRDKRYESGCSGGYSRPSRRRLAARCGCEVGELLMWMLDNIYCGFGLGGGLGTPVVSYAPRPITTMSMSLASIACEFFRNFWFLKTWHTVSYTFSAIAYSLPNQKIDTGGVESCQALAVPHWRQGGLTEVAHGQDGGRRASTAAKVPPMLIDLGSHPRMMQGATISPTCRLRIVVVINDCGNAD